MYKQPAIFSMEGYSCNQAISRCRLGSIKILQVALSSHQNDKWSCFIMLNSYLFLSFKHSVFTQQRWHQFQHQRPVAALKLLHKRGLACLI